MTTLAQILKDNPGCTAILDNDCFWIYKTLDCGDEHPGDVDGNSLYRGDQQPGIELLAAMAELLNINLENV